MATADKKRTLLTETPTPSVNKDLLTDAIRDTKEQRAKAIENAHNALVDAFGPKLAAMASEKLAEATGAKIAGQIVTKITTEESISELDIDMLIKELEGAPEDDDMIKECRRRLNEAKDPSVPISEKERMYRDIHRKFWAYVQTLPNKTIPVDPKKLTESEQAEKKFRENKSGPIQWISYEGSMIISALVAVSDDNGAWIYLSQLPDADKEVVLKMTETSVSGFRVLIDQYKNFECSAGHNDKGVPKFHFTLGNRVASIPPHEASRFGNVDVKVERKGKDILIGDRIKLEKGKIQNLVNPIDPTNNGANRGGFVPRQKVSGRNAYEIRADVLELAVDWAKTNGDKKMDTDDVLDIAEAFYSFVEHK